MSIQPGSPFQDGTGARLTDVDGNEYNAYQLA